MIALFFATRRHFSVPVETSKDVNTTAQLDGGVRLLTAQVHNNNGALHLCHSSCNLLDAGSLSDWLTEIRNWLDTNPYDVVTILLVNSDNVAASDLDGEFAAAAIKDYAYTPESATAIPSSWPTLSELIASGTRLVTFVADISPSPAAPYLMNEFTFIFENPYSVLSPDNFSCTPDRPALVQNQISVAVKSGRLPLMNHFLNADLAFGIQVPDIDKITVTNAASGPVGNLGEAATACTAAYGRAPSFILVDFFEHGSAIDTVDRLNGITPVGRLSRSTTRGVDKSRATGHSSRLSSSLTTSYGLFITFIVTAVASGMT
ncbi:MAG: hypothetical protein Q9211_004620 [Gyalolechia sp. 1 TL-2023]